MKIDFVIPWVDGSDPEWQKSKSLYTGIPCQENDIRYRDWGILKYWFRSVEENAPWVNKIFFVTCGQTPEWLNVNHPKLVSIRHDQYMPKEYLPTFSANPIELNLHRILELSEHFVYFNDDMYLNAPVTSDDFFVNGQPKLSAVLSAQIPSAINDPFSHFLCNDIAFLNTYFDKKKVVMRNMGKWFNFAYGKGVLKNIYHLFGYPGFSMLQNYHMPSPMLKSTFEKVWSLEPELLHSTSLHKTRHPFDVNQYIMSYYDIGMGNFYPRSIKDGRYYEVGRKSERLYGDISIGRHKVICLNDSCCVNYEEEQQKLKEIFEARYPKPSTYEI